MFRTRTILIGSGLWWGCTGGSKGDDDVPEPPVILSTVAGEYPVQGDVTRDTCGGDIADLIDNLIIKLDQVATGLSVFVDPDVGWIPCAGSVASFDCQWGNAPSDVLDETWTWSLVGHVDGDTIDATLRLVVTCPGGGNCEPCQVVADYTGTLDG